MKGGRRTSLLFESSLLATAVFLGTNPVAVKYAVGYVAPLPFAALRFVLAGLVLWGILRHFDPKGRLKREDFWAMAGLGLIGVALNNVAFTFGVSMTSASNTALVVATAPLWGMLLGFALGWERPRSKGVLGVGIALLGVALIVYRGLGTGGTSLPGDLLVMAAAACWGSYAVLSLPLLERYSPLAVAGYSMLFGAWPCSRSPPWISFAWIGVLLARVGGPRSPTRRSWWPPSGSLPGSAGSHASGPTGCSSTSTW